MSEDAQPKCSALRTFLDEIVNDQKEFVHTDLDAFKTTVFGFLEKSKGTIREHDRKKMFLNMMREQNLLRAQTYIYNSLLAYEGLAVVGLLPR